MGKKMLLALLSIRFFQRRLQWSALWIKKISRQEKCKYLTLRWEKCRKSFTFNLNWRKIIFLTVWASHYKHYTHKEKGEEKFKKKVLVMIQKVMMNHKDISKDLNCKGTQWGKDQDREIKLLLNCVGLKMTHHSIILRVLNTLLIFVHPSRLT